MGRRLGLMVRVYGARCVGRWAPDSFRRKDLYKAEVDEAYRCHQTTLHKLYQRYVTRGPWKSVDRPLPLSLSLSALSARLSLCVSFHASPLLLHGTKCRLFSHDDGRGPAPSDPS